MLIGSTLYPNHSHLGRGHSVEKNVVLPSFRSPGLTLQDGGDEVALPRTLAPPSPSVCARRPVTGSLSSVADQEHLSY